MADSEGGSGGHSISLSSDFMTSELRPAYYGIDQRKESNRGANDR